MSCGWGVKAGMVRLWVAGKTVCDRNVTHGPYLRARDKGLIIKPPKVHRNYLITKNHKSTFCETIHYIEGYKQKEADSREKMMKNVS